METSEKLEPVEPLSERIEVLKVPIDIVGRENLEALICRILKSDEGRNIVLLSLMDLLRARRNGEFRNYVQNAALVIPISKSIVNGARFLSGKSPVRYMPFDFAVSLLTTLEQRELSVYLLGAGYAVLAQTEKNIRQTFPKLRIIGRFPGNFKKHKEDTLLQVIRKSSPALLLVGYGVSGREKWLAKNSHRLSSSLRLWCSDLFDIFAKRRKHPSRVSFDRGLEWISFCLRNPLRLFRIFAYLYYGFLLIFYRLSRKKATQSPR